jgi:cell division protein FtsI/penicillin-binding protein 2
VSYPAYDPNAFDKLYSELREDVDHMPLLFRAVATRYAPGSTIKPLTCLAGMINGAIGVDSREVCTGYLHEEVRDAWRCWQIHGTDLRKAHGSIDVVGALTGSCNVFMYRLGDRLGVDRLCSAFDMVGIGRTTGVGLREEVTGINPTPSWLMSELSRSVVPGMARNYSIGQGEIAATPLQIANLMATYASGKWKPVRLLDPIQNRDGEGAVLTNNEDFDPLAPDPAAGPKSTSDNRQSTFGAENTLGDPSPEWRLPGTSEQWLAIRRGICGVTNDPDGTAYKYAHFEQDGWTLCGKTGSATAHPWPTSYRVPFTDTAGHNSYAIVREGAAELAIARFQAENPDATVDLSRVEVASRWPPHPPEDGENHSHAWFGAYLQPLGADGQPDYSQQPKFAFAVLVEFGGSGGQVSGPLAKQVAAELLGQPSGMAEQ